jgi:hypothetical protein
VAAQRDPALKEPAVVEATLPAGVRSDLSQHEFAPCKTCGRMIYLAH